MNEHPNPPSSDAPGPVDPTPPAPHVPPGPSAHCPPPSSTPPASGTAFPPRPEPALPQYRPPVYPPPQAVHGAPPPYGYEPAPAFAPQDYRTAGTFHLIGGITTTIASLVIVGLTIWFCIGLCWVPTLASGIWSIVLGSQASSGKRVPSIRVANAIALVAALFCGDVVGLVMNILALVWLSREDVSRWLDGRP